MSGGSVGLRSGPWTGYYQQNGSKHAMDLELTFADGVLRGAGWDDVGEFTIKGSYDDGGEVRFTKRYVDRHAAYYRGFFENGGIWGTWRIPPHDHAGFHVWPLPDGERPRRGG